MAESCFRESVVKQKIRGRIIPKKRSVGLIPITDESISSEALDETVLRVLALLQNTLGDSSNDANHRLYNLSFCAFNGGKDCWVDVGNKRVGVTILSTFLNIYPERPCFILVINF